MRWMLIAVLMVYSIFLFPGISEAVLVAYCVAAVRWCQGMRHASCRGSKLALSETGTQCKSEQGLQPVDVRCVTSIVISKVWLALAVHHMPSMFECSVSRTHKPSDLLLLPLLSNFRVRAESEGILRRVGVDHECIFSQVNGLIVLLHVIGS